MRRTPIFLSSLIGMMALGMTPAESVKTAALAEEARTARRIYSRRRGRKPREAGKYSAGHTYAPASSPHRLAKYNAKQQLGLKTGKQLRKWRKAQTKKRMAEAAK